MGDEDMTIAHIIQSEPAAIIRRQAGHIAQLEAENDTLSILTGKLAKEASDLRIQNARLSGGWKQSQLDLNQAEAALAEAERALEFYANENNWNKEHGSIHDMKPRGMERKLWKVLDFGDRAREALAALKKARGEGK